MSSMKPNTEIEEIILKAGEAAKSLRHEYVTLEHLSIAILSLLKMELIKQEHWLFIQILPQMNCILNSQFQTKKV